MCLMKENEARETRAHLIPLRKAKEVSVLVAGGIIRFGFIAKVLPVASLATGPSAPAGWANVRISWRGQHGGRLGLKC